MLFFSATAELQHRTPLPPSVTFEDAIALLRDHDFLMHLDPDLVGYEADDPPASCTDPSTKHYTVMDNIERLPRCIWDTKVSFKAKMTNLSDRLEWVIHAPLGVYQKSIWKIEPPSDEYGLCLVEDVEITCSRLLVGTVRSIYEGNWKGRHQKFADKLALTAKET